jgi:hypothetical protein
MLISDGEHFEEEKRGEVQGERRRREGEGEMDILYRQT